MPKALEKIIKIWPILLLVLFTFILRVIKIEDLFYFTYDESIPAFVGRRLLLEKHLPLIGGVTPFNFHLAPYFYWLLSLILIIGKLNPIAWGWAAAIIAMFTTLMMYMVGKTFANYKVGFLAAAFWTFSYLANVYDRHFWALYWGPLVSLIVLYSLYKIITCSVILSPSKSLRAKNLLRTFDKFTILLGIVIALSIHADPSNVVFLALSILVWIIYKLPIKRSTFLAAGFILFSFLPLVVFDLRHNFANTRPVAEFILQGRNNPGLNTHKFINNSLLFPRAASRLIYTFGDNEISKQYSYCQTFVAEKFKAIPIPVLIISTITVLVFLTWSFTRRKMEPQLFVMSLLLALYFVGIQIYGTIFRADIFEHYITGTFALFLLVFVLLVSKLPKKLWLAVLGIFILINLLKFSLAANSQGLSIKRRAIEYTMAQVGNKPFSLDSLSTCWKLNGYRYLFAVFGHEPVKSYVDPNFSYLYGTTPVAERHPLTVVAFVVHDFVPETAEFYKRYVFLKSHETKSAIFGIIEVIIMDNSTGWFDQN